MQQMSGIKYTFQVHKRSFSILLSSSRTGERSFYRMVVLKGQE